MQKVKGYIALAEGEPVPSGAAIIKGKIYVETDVWITGTGSNISWDERMGLQLYEKTHFRPKKGEESMKNARCENCHSIRSMHKGPNAECYAKDEKPMPGRKYD